MTRKAIKAILPRANHDELGFRKALRALAVFQDG